MLLTTTWTVSKIPPSRDVKDTMDGESLNTTSKWPLKVRPHSTSVGTSGLLGTWRTKQYPSHKIMLFSEVSICTDIRQ